MNTTTDHESTRIKTAIFNGDPEFAVDVDFICKDKGLRVATFKTDLIGDIREPRLTGTARFLENVYIAESPVFAVMAAKDTNGNLLPLTSFAIHDITYQLTHKYAKNSAYYDTIDNDTNDVLTAVDLCHLNIC